MPVQSLYDLAKARLIANISSLTDVGDVPYDFLKPVLKKIENPTQLLALERTCPQLAGETGEIWLRFIKRDIPDWEYKPHEPRDPKNWAKVYRKLKKEVDEEKLAQEQKLREQMKALQEGKNKNQTQILEGKVHIPTRRSTGSSSWGQRSGAPAKTGRLAFDKLRRGMFDQKMARPKASLLPAHLLQERKGVVKAAPERLVRIAQAEVQESKNIAVSRGAGASVAAAAAARQESRSRFPSSGFASSDARPISSASPTKAPPERPHLPPGFSAAKIRKVPVPAEGAAAGAPKPKRRREEPSLFHQPKKRRP